MIDWPNLIAGFILGVVASLGFLIWDRSHERAKTRLEARSAWITAATEVVRISWQPDASSGSVYKATASLPVDHWRRILGPDDFVALERMHNAFATVEAQSLHATDEAGRQRLAEAQEHLRRARNDFSDRVHFARGDEHTSLIDREHKRKVRRDYRQHPIITWKRERHNRRVRQEHEANMRETA